MDTTPTCQNASTSIADNNSDYGSELDDDTATELFSQVDSQPLSNVVLESIEEPITPKDDSLDGRVSLRLSQLRQSLDSAHQITRNIEAIVSERRVRQTSVEVEYDESNRRSFSRKSTYKACAS